MQESNTKIYFTSDYGSFRFLRGNRDLNEAKVKKIIKSVTDGLNFFKYCPILVNEDFFIIDGQHRFYVCKKLKLPVFYVIVPNFSLRQVAEINNNQSKWKTKDFMNCYIDADVNKEHYQQLQSFITEHKLIISTGINLLMYGKVGTGGQNESFLSGKFKVGFLDFAVRLIAQAKEYEKYGADWRSRPFLRSIEKLQLSDKYNQDLVLKKLEKHGLTISQQNTSKEYLHHIEELYNFKNSIRQILY